MFTTLDQLEAYIAPYLALRKKSEKKKATKQDYETYKTYLVENLTLPDFYTFENKPVFTVHVAAADSIEVYDSDEVFVQRYESIIEAYDSVRATKASVVFTGDLSLVSRGKTIMGNSLSVKEKPGAKTSRLLLSHTVNDDIWIAKETYLEFLVSAVEYLKDPKDFMKAWEFLDRHPMGWTRHKPDSHYWDTENNVGRTWIVPTISDRTGKVVFMLEHGGQVPPERINRYHDVRLDVYANSYEKGIVKLAKKVHKFFHFDGSDKENVKYKKSNLEKTLDAAVESYEADMKEEKEKGENNG